MVVHLFTLGTNRRLVLKIMGPKERIPTLSAAGLQRWALLLSTYSYELEYEQVLKNNEADTFSR